MEMLGDQVASRVGAAADVKAKSPRKNDLVGDEKVEDGNTSSSSSSSSSSSLSSSMWSSEGKQRAAAIVSDVKRVDAFVSAAASEVLMPAAGAVSEEVLLAGSGVLSSNEPSTAETKSQEIGLHHLLNENTSRNEIVSSSSVDKYKQSEVAEENKQDAAEWDVETVIKEQETHDIICPKCRSCITKTVILRKRKRQPEINNSNGKKTQPSGGNAAPSVPDTMPLETEPVAFRCGACFSFFIQTVAGFRIFKVFQPRSEVQSRPQVPAATGYQGGDFILPIEPDQSAGPYHSTSPTDIVPAPELPPVGQTEPVRSGGCDILKSIVYGGLIEIITSVGVVSSAAGGGGKTINIIALAMANLVTGLLITVNGVRQLKNEPVKEEQDDRYYEVLGRRRNYCRHAVVVVLSFLVFGLLPPLTYGFSFRKTDNREYKLVSVAAVSLVGIALLAAGKARTKKLALRSYISTILLYVSMGVTASGLSFVVGELTLQLLEKLGFCEPSTPAMPKAMLNPPAWAAY